MYQLPAAAADDRPAAPINLSRGEQPARRPLSLRRTTSAQSYWPQGAAAPSRMVSRARDLFTPGAGGSGEELGADWLDATIGGDSRIMAMESSRRQDQLAGFLGLVPGGGMRKAMAAILPDEARDETRLNRLLDDIPGARFVSPCAWYAVPGGLDSYFAHSGALSMDERRVTGACLSFAEGSPSVRPDGSGNEEISHHPVVPLPFGDRDPDEFHELLAIDGPNHWRLKRTDLWIEDGALHADAWFQDSNMIPGSESRRMVFHEYTIQARFEPDTLHLLSIEVTPHILPYMTCRAAPATAKALEGRDAREFRLEVPRMLRGTAGCTHLNDMMRSLQDVNGMSRMLYEAAGRP